MHMSARCHFLPLQGGYYHWNAAFRSYLDAPDPLSLSRGQQQHCDGDGGSSGGGGTSTVLMPRQLRLVASAPLAACLVQALRSSGSGGNSAGGPPDMPPEWPELFAAAQQEAQAEQWASPVVGHEPDGSSGMPAHSSGGQQWTAAAAPAATAHAVAAADGSNAAHVAGAAAPDDPRVPPAEEVRDATEAWALLTRFSCVVGMHPDEASFFLHQIWKVACDGSCCLLLLPMRALPRRCKSSSSTARQHTGSSSPDAPT